MNLNESTRVQYRQVKKELRRSFPFRICQPGALRFGFLNKADHPRGQLILESLLRAGFKPQVVIEEDSEFATFGRQSQLEQLRKVPEFAPRPTSREICENAGISYETVNDHNDPVVVNLLRDNAVELGVIGDARILKRQIIDAASHGIINPHPGVLPEVRGSTPHIWAIIHGLPQGGSIHLINERADRGPVFEVASLQTPERLSFPRLVFEINLVCATALVTVMKKIVSNTSTLTHQEEDSRLTFRIAAPEVRDAAITIQNRRAMQYNESFRSM